MLSSFHLASFYYIHSTFRIQCSTENIQGTYTVALFTVLNSFISAITSHTPIVSYNLTVCLIITFPFCCALCTYCRQVAHTKIHLRQILIIELRLQNAQTEYVFCTNILSYLIFTFFIKYKRQYFLTSFIKNE